MVPSLKDVGFCAHCMARWIRKYSEEAIPAAVKTEAAPVTEVLAPDFSAVDGIPWFDDRCEVDRHRGRRVIL